MRMLSVVLFAAACAFIFVLGSQADPANEEVKSPNPMKVNEQQFARMQRQETMYAKETVAVK